MFPDQDSWIDLCTKESSTVDSSTTMELLLIVMTAGAWAWLLPPHSFTCYLPTVLSGLKPDLLFVPEPKWKRCLPVSAAWSERWPNTVTCRLPKSSWLSGNLSLVSHCQLWPSVFFLLSDVIWIKYTCDSIQILGWMRKYGITQLQVILCYWFTV